MELNNYKSVTPLKKKRRKVTVSGAVILCLISLVIGVFCGKASVDKDMKKYVSKDKYNEIVAKNAALEKNEETYEVEINRLKKELADANVTIANNEQQVPQQTEVPGEVAAQADDTQEPKNSASGGFGRTLFIIILIALIGGCGFFIVKIYLKKKSEDYDDEYEYDDDDEYDEDDDEYYDDDDEEYDEDDDEYYDEDDEDDEDYDDEYEDDDEE